MKPKDFWKAHNNIRPLQVYKLNDFEAFSVGKINLLEGKAYGSVIPIQYINEKFVEIIRFDTVSLENFKLKLLKDFKGYWNGRYWEWILILVQQRFKN